MEYSPRRASREHRRNASSSKPLVSTKARLVYEVALLDAWEDEADAGYYQDASFSEADMIAIVDRATKIGDGLKRAAAAGG